MSPFLVSHMVFDFLIAPPNPAHCRSCTPFCHAVDTQGTQFLGFNYDNASETTCFAAYNPNVPEIIVSFRGTNEMSVENWIINLDAFKVDTQFVGIPNAYVHSGFYYGMMCTLSLTGDITCGASHFFLLPWLISQLGKGTNHSFTLW